MKTTRFPGFLAYAFTAMWLLLTAIAPVRAEDGFAGTAGESALSDHAAEIRDALRAQGVSDDAEIALSLPAARLPIGADEMLSIESASFNPASGRFLVRASAGANDGLIAITGSALKVSYLPVPVRLIDRNETIAEGDLDFVRTTDPRATQFVGETEAIVGKIARRPLAAGAPVRKSDLAAPILIKRGATATIVLQSPGIRLTQVATALSNGAAGDLITFRNINSSREIKAVVIAENIARAPFAERTALASLETGQ